MILIDIAPILSPRTSLIPIPGSKSYTNRALILAALTPGPVTLENPLFCDDTEAMIACLRSLGIHIETQPTQLVVHNDIAVIQNKTYPLFAKDSGTTIRFLLALLCLTPGTKILSGSPQLNQRPIHDLVEALRQLGARIDYIGPEGQPPLRIHPCTLRKNQHVEINAAMSSQFISALLLIAPHLDGLKIQLKGKMVSKPYVDMTIEAMRSWGVAVDASHEGVYDIAAGQHYRNHHYAIEGDYSSAGYFFAIAALTGSMITVTNLHPHSLQADRKFLDMLAAMGNQVLFGENGVTVKGKQIVPSTLAMEECPDQVQTMAVLAAFANGTTHISGVRSLRVKETDRVTALKTELGKMGIVVEETHDTLTIHGGTPQPATIDTYGDHRMAMAFAVAGTRLSGMKIRHPDVVNKTFPSFWNQLRAL